jgi:hypothetical protein
MSAVTAGAASSGPELTTTSQRATKDWDYHGPSLAIFNWTRQLLLRRGRCGRGGWEWLLRAVIREVRDGKLVAVKLAVMVVGRAWPVVGCAHGLRPSG